MRRFDLLRPALCLALSLAPAWLALGFRSGLSASPAMGAQSLAPGAVAPLAETPHRLRLGEAEPAGGGVPPYRYEWLVGRVDDTAGSDNVVLNPVPAAAGKETELGGLEPDGHYLVIRQVTDSGSPPATAQSRPVAVATRHKAILFIGDSITYGGNAQLDGRLQPDPAGKGWIWHFADREAAGLPDPAALVVLNAGVNGATSADWAPGGELFKKAIAEAEANDVSEIHVMLGTNDAARTHLLSPLQHQANLAALIDAVHAAPRLGRVKIYLHASPWIDVERINRALPGFAPFDMNAILESYQGAERALAAAHPGLVVACPPLGYRLFRDQGPDSKLSTDGVHPDDAGHAALGRAEWEAARQAAR